MRLWIICLLAIWGPIACTTNETSLSALPTGSPVYLTIEDTDIHLHTPSGWRAYVEQRNIVLTNHHDELRDVVVNIWVPDMDMALDRSFSDVVDSIATSIEHDHGLRVTQPSLISWNDHDAAYFVISNDDDYASMIFVININGTHTVAMNVRGVSRDFVQVRQQLATVFESFRVNEVVLGNDGLLAVPTTLSLPSNNPSAALEASAEP